MSETLAEFRLRMLSWAMAINRRYRPHDDDKSAEMMRAMRYAVMTDDEKQFVNDIEGELARREQIAVMAALPDYEPRTIKQAAKAIAKHKADLEHKRMLKARYQAGIEHAKEKAQGRKRDLQKGKRWEQWGFIPKL